MGGVPPPPLDVGYLMVCHCELCPSGVELIFPDAIPSTPSDSNHATHLPVWCTPPVVPANRPWALVSMSRGGCADSCIFLNLLRVTMTMTEGINHTLDTLCETIPFVAWGNILQCGLFCFFVRLAKYQAFKGFSKRMLVATDLFGRGMDIERVNIVFNYDMPENSDTYLHRVRLWR